MIEVLGTAEFSEDMVETLRTYFIDYAVGGVVGVEVTDRGLWLVNPDGRSRQFLGLARLPATIGKRSAKIPKQAQIVGKCN